MNLLSTVSPVWPAAPQWLLVAYVMAAALVLGVLLGMLRAKLKAGRRRSARRSASARETPFASRFDDGPLTEPASWGYKLGDFANLSPVALTLHDVAPLATTIRPVPLDADGAKDDLLHRKPLHRARGRRSIKPLRRHASSMRAFTA